MTWFQYSSRRFRLAVTWPWSGRRHTSQGEAALSRSLKSVTYWSCSPWISSSGRGAILPTQRTASNRYRLTPKRRQAAPSTRVIINGANPVSYTHLRAHETRHDLVCRLLLEKKKK